MEILDLRHLRSRDLAPLLEEEKKLWQRDLAWDYSASAALIRRYVDASALPGYVAVEDGRTLGYSFYVYENYKGVVGDVFASDSPRAEATEAKLLAHVIETLQATPGLRRIEAQLMTLRHDLSCDFFKSRGLQSFRRQFMTLPLDADAVLPPPIPNIRVELWHQRYLADAAELITRAYRGHIDSAISDQYRSHTGAVRFLDNIIHYPGCGDFDPDCSFLAFRKDDAQLCGMALSSIVGDRVSHITQICVRPELRGNGIGRALIASIVRRLRQRRSRAVTLTVTHTNTTAIRLYEQLRFSVLKEFYAFAWDANGRESELGR